jgi:hypothetical protein
LGGQPEKKDGDQDYMYGTHEILAPLGQYSGALGRILPSRIVGVFTWYAIERGGNYFCISDPSFYIDYKIFNAPVNGRVY